MGKYSVYSGREGIKIDRLINNYLNIITEEVRKAVDRENLLSVILIGGFARTEGSMLIEKNRISPLNDFDIFIITKMPLKIDLKKLSLDCLKKCGIKSEFSFKESLGIMQFYIDFRNMTLEELKKVPSFIKYYEIKNSSKIIYGEDVLKYIPNYKLSDIPPEEGLRHMFNRLSLLAEYLVPSYEKLNAESKKTAMFFIGKCYLSIAEAFLLYSGDFVCSYKKRAEIFKKNFRLKFPELYNLIPDLDRKVELHTNLKLKPRLINMNYESFWFEARNDVMKCIIYYLNLIYGLRLKFREENILRLSLIIKKILRKKLLLRYLKTYLKQRGIVIKNSFFLKTKNRPSQIYLNFLYFRELKKIFNIFKKEILFSATDPGIKFYSALILCVFSANNDKSVNKKLLAAAYKSVDRFFPAQNFNNDNSFSSWKNLCSLYTRAFRVYQFLKV
jgi:hypothetical protein